MEVDEPEPEAEPEETRRIQETDTRQSEPEGHGPDDTPARRHALEIERTVKKIEELSFLENTYNSQLGRYEERKKKREAEQRTSDETAGAIEKEITRIRQEKAK